MRFYCIRITQPSGRDVYSFAATAETLLHVVDVPHIGRGDAGELVGYQRPEVSSHIAEIRRYLDSDGAVLPNTIVVAFGASVCFEPAGGNTAVGPAEPGFLVVPEPPKGERRPGFVVDGQQRLAAIAGSRHAGFPFFVTAMVAPDVAEQRKQFVLVNRTKPLPPGMIYELLPEIEGTLPQALQRQQAAAQLAARLNLTPGSILYERVRTPTCPKGVIKDNSLRRTLLNSLSDGALLEIGREHRGSPDAADAMTATVDAFWRGVAATFSEAWDLPPKKSRLTHGVGIVALGYIMDELYSRSRGTRPWTPEAVEQGLAPLVPHCAWTAGTWAFGGGEDRPWNGLQNTDRDVRQLAAYLRRLLPPAR
jgi:DGQHR domain-containing protein